MAVYRCEVCDYLFDEQKEGIRWNDLPDDWLCPVCESAKSYFRKMEEEAVAMAASDAPVKATADFRRHADAREEYMADIRYWRRMSTFCRMHPPRHAPGLRTCCHGFPDHFPLPLYGYIENTAQYLVLQCFNYRIRR